MSRARRTCFVVRAWYQLVRFDLAHALLGRMRFDLAPLAPAGRGRPPRSPEIEDIVDAFVLATCWYWKQTLCLQRSICLARLLRAEGVPACVVIGYRRRPFLSHAWVEVEGHVVNDSPVYAHRLHILHRL